MLDDGGKRRAATSSSCATLGFRIALDDFGTGYSSLGCFRQLAVDKIEVDRSFVADLQHSRDARAIVAAIVTLGRAIGFTVSAEGVETEAQMEILSPPAATSCKVSSSARRNRRSVIPRASPRSDRC